MYWYEEVYTGMYQKNVVCTCMYWLVPMKSMRSSCPAPSIVPMTDLHPAFNLSFVSHTTGVAPGLMRERRCSLEVKHRMGLSVGGSSRPRTLANTALPALKLAGTGSSKSPIGHATSRYGACPWSVLQGRGQRVRPLICATKVQTQDNQVHTCSCLDPECKILGCDRILFRLRRAIGIARH